MGWLGAVNSDGRRTLVAIWLTWQLVNMPIELPGSVIGGLMYTVIDVLGCFLRVVHLGGTVS